MTNTRNGSLKMPAREKEVEFEGHESEGESRRNGNEESFRDDSTPSLDRVVGDHDEHASTALSFMYAIIIIVLGLSCPLAEIFAHHAKMLKEIDQERRLILGPLSELTNGFFLYLFVVSVLFCLFVDLIILGGLDELWYYTRRKMGSIRRKMAQKNVNGDSPRSDAEFTGAAEEGQDEEEEEEKEEEVEEGEEKIGEKKIPNFRVRMTRPKKGKEELKHRKRSMHVAQGHLSTGSFYMRLGAVAFGIGSMIHDVLRFGHLIETNVDGKCHGQISMSLPVTHILFTFVQLYFIFHNSKMAFHRYKMVARFGLMHMMATNLCVWLRTLVIETVHHIDKFQASKEYKIHFNLTYGVGDPHGLKTRVISEDHNNDNNNQDNPFTTAPFHSDNDSVFYQSACNSHASIMGNVFTNASPYLYPCTIEYSLICAGILFVMWQNIGHASMATSSEVTRRKTERMTVDCRGASHGLFFGILVLVGTIICLIGFFVLVHRKDYEKVAVDLLHYEEMTVYALALIASLLAFYRMRRHLVFLKESHADIDDMILIISLPGIFIFSIFGIIAGRHTIEEGGHLVIITCLLDLVQAVVQTLFILEAMRRRTGSSKVMSFTPGRNCVTFLLICNISMWGINVFETQRSDANPYKWHFYGHSSWTIINHIATPLSILYRFHSTVCLSNIWKNAYKFRPQSTKTDKREED